MSILVSIPHRDYRGLERIGAAAKTFRHVIIAKFPSLIGIIEVWNRRGLKPFAYSVFQVQLREADRKVRFQTSPCQVAIGFETLKSLVCIGLSVSGNLLCSRSGSNADVVGVSGEKIVALFSHLLVLGSGRSKARSVLGFSGASRLANTLTGDRVLTDNWGLAAKLKLGSGTAKVSDRAYTRTAISRISK